ncbi:MULTISPECIES: alpha/beta hydrolase [unclassified Pseudomonas]|uniref:alpha/beta hydrolase n=1 Tax=unclassified Pseudomonas TaxID=196821 RepID=UPI000C887913|nr:MULTISPECIES: alpha/beta hydrolase [unclassified Pseudomonas]MBI6953049.1 alpha/beta hydrolase [Pseudomonas sp. CCOS 191]PMZ93940.1 alpha/beta hydrolase [Pseudomonas sp. FW305-42]PNA24642.1 alpha/beta hydrolase [Pseudomonas sp. MPR-R1B]PNB23149.1 alpha/beta hydrolase [Pseudomonas sp. DP16D-E2]PNB43213.1 alpha/beta hydrolase [Pseudomonas sp. FW305-17]
MKSRLAALLLLFCTSLAQAAPTVLQRPIDLDTGQGVLHGSLLLPQQATPPPVVLIIAGSGPTDRDGNNPAAGRIDNLKRLALLLAGEHIASVRFDKRGVAASQPATPDERDLSVERYVADVVAWGRALKQDPRFGPLILVGHSEGALIASLAAEQAGASAVITLAGSGRPVADVLREQLAQRLPPAQLPAGVALIDRLQAGQTSLDVPAPLRQVFRPSVQPYLITLLHQDPAAAFARLKVPALIVQGRNDIQVEVADAERLKAAKPDAQLALIDGMNHVLRISPRDMSQQRDSYRNPELPLARELGERIVLFIQGLPQA